MTSSGVVVKWHADRGFGFIAADVGGPNVFCHVHNVQGPAALAVGERVHYDVERDSGGRPRATNVVPAAGAGASTLLLQQRRLQGLRGLLGEDPDGAAASLTSLASLFGGLGLGRPSPAAPPRQGPRHRSFVATAEAGSRPICLRYAAGGPCGDFGEECSRGYHLRPDNGGREALAQVSPAKMRLLQQKWADAEGPGSLVHAWQLKNTRLEFMFSATKHNFGMAGRNPDMIDGWHGSPEANILSIAREGFDTSRRSGQVYGSGEYFAKDPKVSIAYAKGGCFLILCKLLLGDQDVDHTWVPDKKYYVLKQAHGNVQALPLFILQFQAGGSQLALALKAQEARDEEIASVPALARRMRGGLRPVEGRQDAGMVAQTTRHLWLGWLDPQLRRQSDEAIAADVQDFLRGVAVQEVIPERNGVRVGAYARLSRCIDQATFAGLQQRLYRGQFKISVDDQQPDDTEKAKRPCPRLVGPAKACRGWNLSGHARWHMACPFSHAESLRPTCHAGFTYELLRAGTAKYDEIEGDLLRSAPFPASDGSSCRPQLVCVRRIRNDTLERLYEERRAYTAQKQGTVEEKELWHGTNPAALPELLTHGLQPPADRRAAESCPRSGGKRLCTTLCDRTCPHCVEPHHWSRCHMFGLGVYFADMSRKSHRYVRSERDSKTGKEVYSLLRCRVCLGKPYLIEGNLLHADAMHDFVLCDDPSDVLESVAEDWAPTGHDAYYVRGLQRSMKSEHGVYNSEYIIFHGWQALPLYRIDYILQ